jgi:heptosyltransferase II
MHQTQSPWPSTPPSNIIIRMPNWLGDLVMATPLIADLRKKWPNARITAMCQSNVAPLLKNDPNLNEVFGYARPSGWIHRRQHWQIVQSIKHGEYDLGILLTNSFSSAWWFWRAGVTHKIGFANNMRSWLLNKAVPFPKERKTQHLVKTYKALLEPLGIPLSNTPPHLYISSEEMQAAQALLTNKGINLGQDILVGINPGAAYGSAKCWLPERFVAVTQQLLKNPQVQVVYFGDPAGTPLVNDICKKIDGRVINLAGKTNLRELIALINCCSIFLTNDSGPMHIAAALQVPLLALFGSTNDTTTGPYQFGKVIHKHVECSPCYKRICPIDFRCMKRIEVDEVYQTLEQMITDKQQH